MPAIVRIGVEQGKTRAVAGDDVVGLVVARLGDAGEQARVELRFGRENVFNPPRGVQRFHGGSVEVEVTRLKLNLFVAASRLSAANIQLSTESRYDWENKLKIAVAARALAPGSPRVATTSASRFLI